MQYKQLGFSLMELMIVIGIIGILVAIAIPSYKTYTRRAHYAEIVQAAAPFKIGVEECFQIMGLLNECQSGQHGVPPSITDEKGKGLVKSIIVANNGVITIIPKNKYGIKTEDAFLLTPMALNGALHWSTSGGGVNKGYAS